mgnify:CR=1 FL=1
MKFLNLILTLTLIVGINTTSYSAVNYSSSYTASNGITYRTGDVIKLNKVSSRFQFVYTSSSIRGIASTRSSIVDEVLTITELDSSNKRNFVIFKIS